MVLKEITERLIRVLRKDTSAIKVQTQEKSERPQVIERPETLILGYLRLSEDSISDDRIDLGVLQDQYWFPTNLLGENPTRSNTFLYTSQGNLEARLVDTECILGSPESLSEFSEENSIPVYTSKTQALKQAADLVKDSIRATADIMVEDKKALSLLLGCPENEIKDYKDISGILKAELARYANFSGNDVRLKEQVKNLIKIKNLAKRVLANNYNSSSIQAAFDILRNRIQKTHSNYEMNFKIDSRTPVDNEGNSRSTCSYCHVGYDEAGKEKRYNPQFELDRTLDVLTLFAKAIAAEDSSRESKAIQAHIHAVRKMYKPFLLADIEKVTTLEEIENSFGGYELPLYQFNNAHMNNQVLLLGLDEERVEEMIGHLTAIPLLAVNATKNTRFSSSLEAEENIYYLVSKFTKYFAECLRTTLHRFNPDLEKKYFNSPSNAVNADSTSSS